MQATEVGGLRVELRSAVAPIMTQASNTLMPAALNDGFDALAEQLKLAACAGFGQERTAIRLINAV